MAIDWDTDKTVVAVLAVLVVMLASMLLGGQTGQILFSYTIVAFFGLYVLVGTEGSARRYSYRPFLALVGILMVMLGAVFAALWYFHFQNPAYTDPVYWLGFPRATAIVVYLLWMPPALYMMFAYPYLFDSYLWSDEEVAEFEEMERSEVSPGGDRR